MVAKGTPHEGKGEVFTCSTPPFLLNGFSWCVKTRIVVALRPQEPA